MQTEVYYNPDKPKVHMAEQYKDGALKYTVDFAHWYEREGASSISVDWSVKSGSASVGADSEASQASTALVTTGTEGVSLIEVKATLDDGQIGIQFIKVYTPYVDAGEIRY